MHRPYSPLALIGAAMLLTAFGGYHPIVMANNATGTPSDETVMLRKRRRTPARASAPGRHRP